MESGAELARSTATHKTALRTESGNLCRWPGEQAEAWRQSLPGSLEPKCSTTRRQRPQAWLPETWVCGRWFAQATYQPATNCSASTHSPKLPRHLGKQLIKKFQLADDSATQHYAIGFKELRDLDPDKYVPGKVVHAMGWPLNHLPGGFSGGFIYHPEHSGRRRPHRRLVTEPPEPVRRIQRSSITRRSPSTSLGEARFPRCARNRQGRLTCASGVGRTGGLLWRRRRF
jgi:hypothetical protein